MPQIPASLPADAAAPNAAKGAAADPSSAGAFTAVLLGVSPQGQDAAAQAAAGANAAGAVALQAGPAADADGDAENKSAAAAINAAVMETIARQQKAANGLLQADVTAGAGEAVIAGGKGQGLAAAPGQTGATPANGAPPPGLAGATPGQAGNGETVAGGQVATADAAKAALAAEAAKADGMPTGAPTSDAHAASNAEAAIKAGALQDPKGGANAAAVDALADDAAVVRTEARPADATRPAPATEPMPPSAADALSRGPGSGHAAGAPAGESQTTIQQTASATAAAAQTGTDQMQPGTAAQPRPVMPAQPVAEQVAVHIQRAAAEGLDRIMIHLNPPDLGRVDVKLEFGHDGRIQAIISADNPDALDTLRHDARALERALADAGVKSDPGSLQFQLRGEGRGGNDQAGTGGSNSDAPGAASEDADLPEDAVLARPAEWQDGLVDIRV